VLRSPILDSLLGLFALVEPRKILRVKGFYKDVLLYAPATLVPLLTPRQMTMPQVRVTRPAAGCVLPSLQVFLGHAYAADGLHLA